MRLEWDTVQGFVGDIHSILVSTASWSRNNTVCVISGALMAALKGIKARSATAHQERYPNSVALYAGGVVTGKKTESRVPGWMGSTGWRLQPQTHKPNGHKGRSRTIDGICGPPASSPSHPSELASASGVGLAKPRMHRKNATPLPL